MLGVAERRSGCTSGGSESRWSGEAASGSSGGSSGVTLATTPMLPVSPIQQSEWVVWNRSRRLALVGAEKRRQVGMVRRWRSQRGPLLE
jgi:hypothetical protein